MTNLRELPRLDAHVPRCGTPRRAARARWRAAALIAVHLLVAFHVAHWKLSGRTMTPLEPSESMQTLELGYVNAGFVVFAGLLLATLLFGRFFCGWACHVVAYQDLCAWLLERFGMRPRPLRARVLKFVPLAAAFYMFAWPTLVRWFEGGAAPAYSAHFTTTAFWRTFPGPWMAALTIAVDGVLVVWWLGAKGFCTYGCPYGALFGLVDRAAPGRILVSDACEGCGHCTAVCTSNVRVHHEVATFGMVVDPGCMKCLDCVNSCPKQALRFGFAAPSIVTRLRSWITRGARTAVAPASRSDLTWPEELLAAATFLLAFYAFRDLYSAVPFLLAIGMATLAAVAALLVKRQLGSADFRWQRRTWREAGRTTRGGRIGLSIALLLLVFVVHSTFVNHHARLGERELQRWLSDPRDATAAHGAQSHLTATLAAGLFPDGKAENLLAIYYARSGAPDRALPHLTRALAVERTVPRLLALARIRHQLGQDAAAIDALREVLALEPENAEARRLLASDSR